MATQRAMRAAYVAAFVAVGATYAATSAPYVLGGDNGELAAVAAHGGVPHPPGYPLFVLVQRAFSWLPASSPAHRSALVTALVATLSVATLAWAARAWGASRSSALVAALLFAVGPLSWDLATHAEVFSLNVLLAMAIVGLSSPRLAAPRDSETARAALLALLAGLGLSNHHSIVLLAPLGLYAFGRAVLRSGSRGRALALSGAAFAVGLSPYAYLVATARATPLGTGCVWGDPRDWAGLLRHFFRTEYGTVRLGISETEPDPFGHVAALGATLFRDLLGAPLVVVVGAALAWRARERTGSLGGRVPLLLLVLSFVIAGPVFVSRFNLPPSGLAGLVTERFHLLPLALASVLLALAIDACVRSAAGASEASRTHALRIVIGLGALVVPARAALSYPEVRERQRPTTELWLHNALAIAPPGALILASGDDRVGALLYARCATRERPDVAAIAPRLLLTTWYPPQVSARLELDVIHGERREGAPAPVLASNALVHQLLATGRPIFVTDWFARGLAESIPSYPIGPLIRLLPRREDVPPPPSLALLNEDAFSKMQFEETLPDPGTWSAHRLTDYARPWMTLAEAAARAGDVTAADHFRARARPFLAPE